MERGAIIGGTHHAHLTEYNERGNVKREEFFVLKNYCLCLSQKFEHPHRTGWLKRSLAFAS